MIAVCLSSMLFSWYDNLEQKHQIIVIFQQKFKTTVLGIISLLAEKSHLFFLLQKEQNT